MAEYSKAPEIIITMAQELIRKYHRKRNLDQARIGFLVRDVAPINQGRQTWGKATKVTGHMTAYIDYDFVIWISGDVWVNLTEAQRMALIDHELCHCNYLDDKAQMRGHDVEEFTEIIERHGHWTPSLRSMNEAAYQLSLQFQEPRGKVVAIEPDSAGPIMESVTISSAGRTVELLEDEKESPEDDLFEKVIAFDKELGPGQITPPKIQRKFRIAYARADLFMKRLQNHPDRGDDTGWYKQPEGSPLE